MSTTVPARALLMANPQGAVATRCPALLDTVEDGAEPEAAGAVVAVTGEVGSVDVWAAAMPEEKADAAAAGLLSVSTSTESMRWTTPFEMIMSLWTILAVELPTVTYVPDELEANLNG